MAPSSFDPETAERRASDLVPLSGGAAPRPGRVTLVGAGPGDSDLLTLKAVKALARAQVVVHDRLVSEAVLAHAPASARRIYVGKQKARHALPQGDIDALLVGLARSGLEVVRLKGGDPFVFGRGGEEMLACRAAGVACEIVPGVSAAVAAAASAGAPLTHRGLAQAVTLVTGHAAPDAQGERAPDLDWAALARPNQTVAVYMGLSAAPAIAARLLAAGRDAATPVLIVEAASQPGERRALTTLAGLAEAAQGFAGPAVLLIGETAALADAAAAPRRGAPGREGQGVSEAATAQAVTANRLDTGEVVFRRAAGWAPRLADADLYPDAAAAEAVVTAAKAEPRVVVDPYRIELTLDADLPVPRSYRERVRALGPTVHPDMGKQAEGGALVDALRAASGAGRSTGRLGLIARKP